MPVPIISSFRSTLIVYNTHASEIAICQRAVVEGTPYCLTASPRDASPCIVAFQITPSRRILAWPHIDSRAIFGNDVGYARILKFSYRSTVAIVSRDITHIIESVIISRPLTSSYPCRTGGVLLM